jgi:protein gp37
MSPDTVNGPGEVEGSSYPGIDWVICGGESGAAARPMHEDWARALRDQCTAAGVAYHFKQWGEWLPMGQTDADGCVSRVDKGERPGLWDYAMMAARVGKKRAGRFLDGRTWDELPTIATPAPEATP